MKYLINIFTIKFMFYHLVINSGDESSTHESRDDSLLIINCRVQLMSKQSFRVFWNHIIEKTKQSAEKLYRQETENNIHPIRREMDIDFTPHTFRHTYATNLYYAGVDVKTAQYLMGHSSVDITLKIYTHLDAEKTDMAIDKINQYFA